MNLTDVVYLISKFNCRGRIWTCDLGIMSPTSYQTALPCTRTALTGYFCPKGSTRQASLVTTAGKHAVVTPQEGHERTRCGPRSGYCFFGLEPIYKIWIYFLSKRKNIYINAIIYLHIILYVILLKII